MAEITVDYAVQVLEQAGTLTVSSRYGDIHTYVFAWQGFTLTALGFEGADGQRTTLPGINLFSRQWRNLHPVLTLYQEYIAIQRMTETGYEVLLDETSDRRFRVRVRRKEGRRFVYNEHTASTSGYPIVDAFEKWFAYADQKKRIELEADMDVEYAAKAPTRFEVFFYQSDWDGVFYHGQTRRMVEPEGGFAPLDHPRVGVTGIRRQPYIRVETEAPTAATAESLALQMAQAWTSDQDTVVRMTAEVTK